MNAAATDSPRGRTWLMYRALVGVGMLCGLLIVSVFALTLPVIQQNQAEALDQAVFAVLPGAAAKRAWAVDQQGGFHPATEADPAGNVVYAGYGEDGALVGVAIQGAAMGYADTIRVLYGYDPGVQAVVGMQVLASKETPGLGDKIEKDPAFLANFESLDVSLAPGGAEVANPVVAVKSGEKTEPWQLDGITGATISSKAIARILREGSARWVPLVHRARDSFTVTGGIESDG